MPTVSVVIPFYNRVEWLKEAIRSVFSQTYDDYEIVVVNDGSEEDISSLANLFSKKLRYFERPHKGRSAARNEGMRLAGGKYIAFLDADDLFMPEKLKRQVVLMEKNPHILLSHTSYTRIDAAGNCMDIVESGRFTGSVYPRIVYGCPIATPTVMLHAEAVKSLSFEEALDAGEDILLWSLIAKKAPILGIPEPLTQVRIHGCNAAFKPYEFLEANRTIIRYACRDDSNLSPVFRLKAHSSIYSLTAEILRQQKNYLPAAKFAALSFFLWPITTFMLALRVVTNPESFLTLIVLCTPKKYRPYLTRLRRAFQERAKAIFGQ